MTTVESTKNDDMHLKWNITAKKVGSIKKIVNKTDNTTKFKVKLLSEIYCKCFQNEKKEKCFLCFPLAVTKRFSKIPFLRFV